MPPRVKPLKREYGAADDDDVDYDAKNDGEIVMKMTKKPKKVKKEPTTSTAAGGADTDADGGPQKTKDIVELIGFNIATGPIQDEALHEKYKAMSLDELKQYMKMNKMPMSETAKKNKKYMYKKGDLVAHCVDGEKWGRYPPCPVCQKKSTLRVTYEDENHKGQGKWKCHGYWDANIGGVVRCSFNYSEAAQSGAPQERLPWREPGGEYSDDEQEDVNEGLDKPVTFPEGFGELAPKEMATEMIKICREHGLTVPKDDQAAIREAFVKIMASEDYEGNTDYVAAFGLLKEAYPKQTEEQKAGGPAPANAENAALCAALEAIFHAAKAAGEDPMKASAYAKAAMSVRNLPYKVEDGVKMGKPGKMKVENIGPSLGAQIQYFLDHGKFERMEYYARGEIPPSAPKPPKKEKAPKA